MKCLNIKLLTLLISSFVIVACGGGSSGSGVGKTTTKLGFSAESLDGKKSVAREISPDEPVVANGQSVTRAVNSGGGERARLIAEDVVGALKSVFPVDLNVTEFSVPVEIRDGITYLAAAGDFQVPKPDGELMDCTILISQLDGKNPVECLFAAGLDVSPVVKTAVIREGNYEGDVDSNDSVYWTTNLVGGGFSINKYGDSGYSTLYESDTGKVTELLYGEYAIFAYDSTGESERFVFGNEANEVIARNGTSDYFIEHTERPVLFKNYVIYPVRNTPAGIRSGAFMMGNATIISFGEESSINCGGPSSQEFAVSHITGTVWISAEFEHLCEVYEINNGESERLGLRFLNDDASWRAVKISNQVMVGIAEFNDDVTRLIVEDLGVDIPSNETSREVSLVDWKDVASLDTVVALSTYIDGIIIEGTKAGKSVTRYCETGPGGCTFVSDVENGNEIKDRVLLTEPK